MASSTIYAGEHSITFRTLGEEPSIEWEQGSINRAGEKAGSSQYIRNKNMIALTEDDFVRIEVPNGYRVYVHKYSVQDDTSSYIGLYGPYTTSTTLREVGFYHVVVGNRDLSNLVPSKAPSGVVLYRQEKNTWTEWHLIPTTRPVVAEAGVSTNFIEIPGRGDPVDLTDYLTGKPVYGPRSGSWEFIIDNYHEYWEAIRMRIVDFIHGKRLRVILSDIPTRYYEGRFTVSTLEPGENFSNITINYVLDVHSYSLYGDNEDWLWDPFNFDTDYTDARDREGRL